MKYTYPCCGHELYRKEIGAARPPVCPNCGTTVGEGVRGGER